MQAIETKSFPNALKQAAETWPDARMTVYDSRCKPKESRSIAQLIAAAETMGARLVSAGARAGDRVIVSLVNSWEWYEVWLGAMMIGALPVAISPGFALGSAQYQEAKTFDLARRLEARILITSSKMDEDGAPDGLTILDPDALADLPVASDIPTNNGQDRDTLYLQLTSGSTGVPKAAQVTHLGLIHNTAALFQALASRRGAMPKTGVFWLPLYHDFGLVMSMGSLLHGLDLHIYPPRAFLSRPGLWWKQATSHESVLTAAPNFAYQHSVNKVSEADRTEIDMSRLHSAMLGAELNRKTTMDRFVDGFADCGCTQSVLTPAYGMAETTLAVSVHVSLDEPRVARSDSGNGPSVVTCGTPVMDAEFRIQSPDGSPCPDGTEGRVFVRSPDIVNGYFRDPAASDAAIEDGWLDTGDLGFMRDGEFFATGRSKEILIIQGVNYMPDEFERLAEAEAGGDSGGGTIRAAAISVPDEAADATGAERPVLVVEVERNQSADALAKLRDQITGKIGRELGVPMDEVVFVTRGAIPRTSSGKLQRGLLRTAYLQGEITSEG